MGLRRETGPARRRDLFRAQLADKARPASVLAGDLVCDFVNGVFHLPLRSVGFALILEVLVLGQVANRFFGTPLDVVSIRHFSYPFSGPVQGLTRSGSRQSAAQTSLERVISDGNSAGVGIALFKRHCVEWRSSGSNTKEKRQWR